MGNGHGEWFDKQGVLKGRTIRGQLKMVSAKQSSEKESGSTKGSQSQASSGSSKANKEGGSQNSISAAKAADYDRLHQVVQTQQARQQFDAMARKEPLTIAFDKFDNDEVTGNILNAVEETSQGSPYYIFPSRDADIGKLKETYGDAIIDDENAETIYDVLQSIYESGYNAINIVVRKSRAQEIAKLALEQNGNLYNYVMMNIIPVDERSIREQYIAGDIFQIGSLIESHGKVGSVIRRGANHLICVDSCDNKIFRTWISDSKELK